MLVCYSAFKAFPLSNCISFPAIFGGSLEDTLNFERLRNPDRIVPELVEECIRFVQENGLECDGIFRLFGYILYVVYITATEMITIIIIIIIFIIILLTECLIMTALRLNGRTMSKAVVLITLNDNYFAVVDNYKVIAQ